MKRFFIILLAAAASYVLSGCSTVPNDAFKGPYTLTTTYKSESCKIVIIQKFDENGKCYYDETFPEYY